MNKTIVEKHNEYINEIASEIAKEQDRFAKAEVAKVIKEIFINGDIIYYYKNDGSGTFVYEPMIVNNKLKEQIKLLEQELTDLKESMLSKENNNEA